MNELTISFKNCYGIRSLDYKFDFSTKKVFSVYAPNGFMKTSFAKTFKDFSAGELTTDLVFPSRTTIREIKLDGIDLNNNEVFVIEPYNEQFSSDKLSTLLVNVTLKKKYDEIHANIDKKKDEFLKKLKQLSGLTGKGNFLEIEITKSFITNDFYNLLLSLEETVNNEDKARFGSITYNEIFNEKVLTFLQNNNVKTHIKDYIDKFNELLNQTSFLKKEFNHYNAKTIQKNLKDNGFFKANHTVNLYNGKNKVEDVKEDQLESLLNDEINKVFNDKDLQTKFNAIDKLISNAELRQFRNYIFENKDIIVEFDNLAILRKQIWLSYFKDNKELFNNLLSEYKIGKVEIQNIIQKAKDEKTEWKKVIDNFNKRFSVPFKLVMKNQEDVILKNEIPSVGFVFKDIDEKPVNREELLQVLSNGEKRALYILNLIFEVEIRRKQNLKTFFIIDDIADSFDYKNKYAIIEYLKEISEDSIFFEIVLTHNFDFHRTISSRMDMDRSNKLITSKIGIDLIINQEKYQKNPFKFWKSNLNNDNYLIASIPFVRNLVEFSSDENDSDFIKLTSLLHIKADTNIVTKGDLELIYQNVLRSFNPVHFSNPTIKVVTLIFSTADRIIINPVQTIDLESKITLSIAIRLIAEKFMIKEINDSIFVNSISSNQTFELIKKYKSLFPSENEKIDLLEQVNLMTPENIHINSFMFEPILDMSDNHLKQLYIDIKTKCS